MNISHREKHGMPFLLGMVLVLWLSAVPGWAGFDACFQALSSGDYATAVRECRLLAEQGDATAQFNLSLMYFRGQGVPQDYSQAAAWYRRAAEQGNAGAQLNLGQMYDKGWGVPKDDTQAVYWYRRAAEQGNAKAQFNLGVMYFLGVGVPQDYSQAAAWYRRAAEQGDATAQFNLGQMYDNGWGVPQDFMQAYLWYNLAASTLSGPLRETTVLSRDNAAARLTPAQLANAQARARDWRPQPATSIAGISLSPSPTLAPSPQPSPRRDLIRQVQERLQTLGFKPGLLDGTLGPQTRGALRWFQNTQGLVPTGDLDSQTLDALGLR